jgi:glycosyltransferase involved in cell wall biosynthesis
VEHGHTGYLAEAFSNDDLAKGIEWVLNDQERHSRLSDCARERAKQLWSPEVVVPQYLHVYELAKATCFTAD